MGKLNSLSEEEAINIDDNRKFLFGPIVGEFAVSEDAVFDAAHLARGYEDWRGCTFPVRGKLATPNENGNVVITQSEAFDALCGSGMASEVVRRWADTFSIDPRATIAFPQETGELTVSSSP